MALLPALDPTAMGWRHRDWYLGTLRADLFDRSGNIGPTIWADGRIVGGWAQTRGGEVRTRLLVDVGRENTETVDAAAAQLATWLYSVVVTPRFATPLAVELRG